VNAGRHLLIDTSPSLQAREFFFTLSRLALRTTRTAGPTVINFNFLGEFGVRNWNIVSIIESLMSEAVRKGTVDCGSSNGFPWIDHLEDLIKYKSLNFDLRRTLEDGVKNHIFTYPRDQNAMNRFLTSVTAALEDKFSFATYDINSSLGQPASAVRASPSTTPFIPPAPSPELSPLLNNLIDPLDSQSADPHRENVGLTSSDWSPLSGLASLVETHSSRGYAEAPIPPGVVYPSMPGLMIGHLAPSSPSTTSFSSEDATTPASTVPTTLRPSPAVTSLTAFETIHVSGLADASDEKNGSWNERSWVSRQEEDAESGATFNKRTSWHNEPATPPDGANLSAFQAPAFVQTEVSGLESASSSTEDTVKLENRRHTLNSG
jgi:hypothetical protein